VHFLQKITANALLDSFAAAHALASSDGRCRCHTLLAEAGRSATHEALPP
jgi:hypothetical protein